LSRANSSVSIRRVAERIAATRALLRSELDPDVIAELEDDIDYLRYLAQNEGLTFG
jgi:hypothetical protein